MRRRVALTILCAVAAPVAAQTRHSLSDRGLDSLRQDVALDSVDAVAYYRYGLGLWEKHRYDAADSAFQRALHFQPWFAGAHLALGALPFARGGRYLIDLPDRVGRDSAIALIRAAIRHTGLATTFDPRVDLTPLGFLKDDELVPASAPVILAGIRFSLRADIPAVKPMRRAMRALVQQEPDTAFAILAAALAARRPNETMTDQFIDLYASAALRSGHFDAAASGYRELAQRAGRREANAHGSLQVDLGPLGNPRGHYLLLYGVAEMDAGALDVARAALREALLTDLTFYQAHARLADIAEMEGDLDGALAERHAAIAVAPEEGRPYLDLGISLLQAGRAAEARDALLEAARRLPWDAGTQLFLFQAALGAHDRATAQRALAALDLFAPRRNRDQVTDAHRRFAADSVP